MKNNFSCLHVRKLEEEEEEGGTRDLGTARRRGAPGTKKGGEIIISSSSGKRVSFRVRTVEAPFFTRPPPLSLTSDDRRCGLPPLYQIFFSEKRRFFY